MPDDRDDYAMRLIAHRCGDAIAAQIVPASLFVAVMEVIDALQERINALASLDGSVAGGQVGVAEGNDTRAA
jgi:hypothetical protein